MHHPTQPAVLVTGGGGFLGAAIVKQLLSNGRRVRVLCRGDYPWLRQAGCRIIRGDLARLDTVTAAMAGCDAVYHVAAKAGVWGDDFEYNRTNVQGTAHVIEAMRRSRIEYLVYTSTPSVSFAGNDQMGVDESPALPPPQRYYNAYQRSKALAETMVLNAHGQDGLQTLALRPHLIWGPGDTQLVPRVVERARKGRLRLVAGGHKLVDAVYIDNAAQAHLQAETALRAGKGGGEAYYISNDEPWPMRAIIGGILEAHGIQYQIPSLPSPIAYALGHVMERSYGLMRRSEEPPLTRFVARQLATAHYFDISKAKTILGYQPRITMAEGMQRLAEAANAQPST